MKLLLKLKNTRKIVFPWNFLSGSSYHFYSCGLTLCSMMFDSYAKASSHCDAATIYLRVCRKKISTIVELLDEMCIHQRHTILQYMYTKIYIDIYLLDFLQIFLVNNNSNVIHVIYIYYTIDKKFFFFLLYTYTHIRYFWIPN